MHETVTTYHLEITDPAHFDRCARRLDELAFIRCELPLPELNHFFFTQVGRPWRWYSRLPWTYAQWQTYLNDPAVQTWVGYVQGTPVGYCELQRQAEAVELKFFGLLPAFTGQGLGGALLVRSIEQAWAMGAERVWVHTCSLDHPAALTNYQARGFRVFKTETVVEDLPDPDSPLWRTSALLDK